VAPTPEATIKQLTATDAVYEANPIYAPDGSAILFESDATGNREIWLLPTNGAAARQLTDNAGEDTAPYWLPDGSGFVFESTRSGTKSIWRLDLAHAGSAPVQITDDAGDDGSPAVSPDGTLVVYESDRGGNGQDLWLSPVGGGTAVRLTVSVGGSYDRTADWSPDGNTIVFESNRKDGMSALFTVPAKGGAFTQLTPLAGYEGHPAWSPDGRRVAFESGQSGTMEVWCIDVDGKQCAPADERRRLLAPVEPERPQAGVLQLGRAGAEPVGDHDPVGVRGRLPGAERGVGLGGGVGIPDGARTRVAAVKGRCPNH
jgi:Tol biopolymer transport system component